MAQRVWRKLAFLHKIEATYGVDAAPAAADAIVSTNITFTPLEAEEENRDLLLPYMGSQGSILTAEHGKLEFDVEIAGAGVAGDIPAYGSLLRICGMSETVTAGTSVEYDIIEDGVESGTIYFNSDGVQHVFTGARASVKLTFTPKRIPKFRFSLSGLLGTVTDAALPAVSMVGWTSPITVNKANSTMSLHGWTAVAESLEIDLGNTVTPRFLIGEESMLISDRKSSGTAVVEARSIATVDWFARARNATRDELSMVHGTTAGNIVEVSGPKVQIGKPSQGQTDGIVNYSLPLMLCPDVGRDELKLTIR